MMKKYYPGFRVSVIVLLIVSVGYSVHAFNTSLNRDDVRKIHDTDISKTGLSEKKLQEENTRLLTDLKRLKMFSSELESMEVEMFKMRERSHVWDLDYFPPEEHDKIENLLFRYLAIRKFLWDMVNYYKDYKEHFSSPESQTKGFIVGYNAGLHLTSNSSLLVATFINEPMGKSKLNEAYPRSEIPEGTFDMLFSSVTSIDHMEAIKITWILFSDEIKDTDSILYKISLSNPEFRSLIDQIGDLYDKTEARVAYILKEKSLLFPKTTNRLRHTIIVQAAKKMNDTLGDNLYAIRGLLFTNVSDIKFPLTKPLSFSQSQKELLHSLLQPGDIILTYTSGYMSNIFLPGVFKHGIIFIGTPAQRKDIGIIDDTSAILASLNVKKLMRDFSKTQLESGYPADVIEAVAEGVIFNSLDVLMDTHINRMVVLRPRLTEKEKKEALLIVFALLGNDYDFKFDFNDGSYQCCTEVIYRALNSRGNCNFRLVKRMGTLTLSADDILKYHFSIEPRPFEIILYAEKSWLSSGNKAIIYSGNAGLKRLKNLMKKGGL
ncbi:YiiX/YebB-like N1pC/P60 family cysteine hydrolase [Thermodesulfobacteriota bacterium]